MADQEELGPYWAFGKWLREKRLAARLASQPQAEIRARALGLRLINQGKLSHIERGMNGNPEPAFLSQLARLYRLDYPDVVARWMRVRYSIVTDGDSVSLGHGRTGQETFPPREGESDVPASDRRIAELERVVADYETRLGEMHDVASRLVKLAAFGSQKERAAVRAASKSRKRDRTAG